MEKGVWTKRKRGGKKKGRIEREIKKSRKGRNN